MYFGWKGDSAVVCGVDEGVLAEFCKMGLNCRSANQQQVAVTHCGDTFTRQGTQEAALLLFRGCQVLLGLTPAEYHCCMH